jgi:predicted nucleotidyltransferase
MTLKMKTACSGQYRTIKLSSKITSIIKNKLPEIEQEHGVKILYAVESGSRAWGFESADSDYDVRFVYVHEKNWYLNILPKRDVIEYPVTDLWDYVGWDLRKTLFLLNKSNPVLFEWLKSPIVYYRDEYFYSVMAKLSQDYFSPISSVYHYLHMANGNYRQYLQTDEVKIKKYFYVLRPVLAALWIEKYKESPPMEFEKLLALISDKKVLEKIQELLQRKKSGIEMGNEPKIGVINDFLEKSILHLENVASGFDARKKVSAALLEESFVKIIEHSYGE